MPDPLFHLVLYCPEIPPNTGNAARTAAATGCRLHIVHPVTFDLSARAARRAGLDYWPHVDLREHASWDDFLRREAPARLWLYTTRGSRPHWQARFRRGDYLLFGQETAGVPAAVHDWVTAHHGPEARLALPISGPVRSLNLANAVCAAVYEGLRQVSTS
jgi:tRNA (cytidine/uridine-2'-O-)-methyltransferase